MTSPQTALSYPRDVNALLAERYGDGAPQLTEPALLDSEPLARLLSHRSVRQFRAAPISAETITAIVAAAQSAASSSNNQSWSVVEVRDAEARRRLVHEAGGSALIADAPVVLLFVADWARATAVAAREGEAAPAVAYLESTLVAFVDAAIAAQNAVVAAEALGLGTCYLGSLRNRPEITAEIADLPAGAVVTFGVALGWPDPSERAGIKPRLGADVVHSVERYSPADPASVVAYEHTLREYNSRHGRASGWVRAVVGRVRDVAGLHGREPMRDWLTARGLPSR